MKIFGKFHHQINSSHVTWSFRSISIAHPQHLLSTKNNDQ